MFFSETEPNRTIILNRTEPTELFRFRFNKTEIFKNPFTVEHKASDGEKESEENVAGKIKRVRESVGGFRKGGRKRLFNGGVGVAWGNIPAKLHQSGLYVVSGLPLRWILDSLGS